MMDEPAVPGPFSCPEGEGLSRLAVRRGYLVLGAVCLAAFYLAGVTGQWWPTPDSAVYLGLGRSIAAGEGYRFNYEAHNRFPPGLPVILAGLRIAFGEGYWAPNVFIAACGLGAVALMYASMRLLGADAWLAFSAAMGTGLSYPFYFNSHRILTDIPFALVFWATLYAAGRYLRTGGTLRPAGSAWWLALAALLAAAGVCLRAPALLLLGPLAVGIVLEGPLRSCGGRDRPNLRRRMLAGGVILAAAALVTSGLYVLARVAAAGTPGYLGTVSPGLRLGPYGQLVRLGSAAAEMPSALASIFTDMRGGRPAGLVVSILIAAGAVRLWRGRRRLICLLLILYPLGLALCLGRWGIRPRYFLPVVPLFIYASLVGLLWLLRVVFGLAHKRPGPGVPLSAVAMFTAVVLACNLPSVGRNAFYYPLLSRSPDYYFNLQGRKYGDLVRIADILRQDCPPDGLVAAQVSEAIVHFLTGRHTVPLPSGPTGKPAATVSRKSRTF